MGIFKSLFGLNKKSDNLLNTQKLSYKDPHFNYIIQILKGFVYNLESQNLPNDYVLTRFKLVGKSRMIDLIYNSQSQLVRTYLLNVKDGIPDYKDSNNCYTLEMLDIWTGTTSRNSDKYFGENRPDGIYTRTNDQLLRDYYEILLDNKSMILGEEWIPKAQIDQINSKKMGYTSFAGWKPDGQLQIIEKELSFLKQLGFIKKYDDNEIPEYENGFKWERIIIFKNSVTNESIEIMVDYRGPSSLMKVGNENNSEQWKLYNLEEIKLKYR